MNHSVYPLELGHEQAIEAAADAVAEGKCVVFPTDTVYGIGANAFDADAVQRLLDAKERGRDMPVPVLIAEPLMLRALADEIPEAARALAREFWPGPLTLILVAQPKAGMELGDTGGTVAVRVPDHDAARALLRVTGPLAVSSANVSGRAPARTAAEAEAQLGERVAIYLDGGETRGTAASTIVDFAAVPEGRIVRHGALSHEELLAIAPRLTARPEAATPPEEDASAETGGEEPPVEHEELAASEPETRAADEA